MLSRQVYAVCAGIEYLNGAAADTAATDVRLRVFVEESVEQAGWNVTTVVLEVRPCKPFSFDLVA